MKPVPSASSTLVSGPRAARHLPLLLFLSGLLAYGASFAWYMLHHFDLVNVIVAYSDDAFYYFQIARNLADGQFSTFDGGITRTNGYHPLWMLLITPLWWVFDPDGALFAIKVFEIMLVAGAVALIVVAARLARVYWVLLFAALPMLYRAEGLLWGLEAAAGLFMLGLLFLALVLFAREPGRWRWLLTAVAFLLPWVRLEYAAISVAATGTLCFIEWSWRDGGHGRGPGGGVRSVPSLAAFTPLLGACVGVLVYFAWNGIAFGGIVPVSGAAKQLMSETLWELERTRNPEGGYSFVRNFQEVMDSRPFGRELLVALEICVYCLLVWWFGHRSRRPEDRLFLMFLAGMFALSAGHAAKFVQSVLTMHPSWTGEEFPWHYVPAHLMMVLIVPVRCYVAIYLIRRFIVPGRFRVADVSSILLVAATAFVLVERTEFSWPYKYVDGNAGISRIHGLPSSYANALLMNRILPEGSIVGSWDSGIMGYYSRFPVVNLDGLVNSYEYLQEVRDRRMFEVMLSRSKYAQARDNAEYLHRTFGITHFANHVTTAIAEDIENVYSETAPFLHLPAAPHDQLHASVLWSEEPLGSGWLWERLEPHFDARADGVGAIVDGRLTQIFPKECEEWEGGSSLVLLFDGEGRISGISNPWENRWTTARGRRPGSCMDTILLPGDVVRPIRMEVLSEGGDVSRLFGADRGAGAVRSGYDVYLHKKQLVYVNRQCDGDADTLPLFFVHVTPVDDSDLPVGQRRHGVENLDFSFDDFGRRMGNTCIAVRDLPGYGIARVRTGQYVPGAPRLWDVEIRLDVDAGWIAGVVERAEPVIRSDFDVYHDGDRLLYTGAECGDAALAPPFFLHVFPEDEGDLPTAHREHGFHHLDFRFETRRLPLDFHFKDVPAPSGVKCIALVDLPGYEVARIRTGQYVPGGPWLWHGEIRLDVDAGWIAGVAERAEPVIRSDFDVYHDGDRLLYTGAECGEEDVTPPFLLHVFPEDEGNLPADHREHGFHNLDFRFEERRLPLDHYFKDAPAPGGVGCAAVVDLPGYEMARIRTGQYVPGGPWLWHGEFEAGGGEAP